MALPDFAFCTKIHRMANNRICDISPWRTDDTMGKMKKPYPFIYDRESKSNERIDTAGDEAVKDELLYHVLPACSLNVPVFF